MSDGRQRLEPIYRPRARVRKEWQKKGQLMQFYRWGYNGHKKGKGGAFHLLRLEGWSTPFYFDNFAFP